MSTNADYVELSSTVYTSGTATPQAPAGWTLMKSKTDPSGMQA